MTIRRANLQKPVKASKREVEFDGRFYKVKSNSVSIPNLSAMNRFDALAWLCRQTYPRGYSKPNALAGLAGAISFSVR